MYKTINYSDLSSKQKEIYNFQKLAGILADYGFNCIKLSDDWNGADFLAYHFSRIETLMVQLKGRISIDEKYVGKNIHMAFPVNGIWYLIPHDKLVDLIRGNTDWLDSDSWVKFKEYNSGNPSNSLILAISDYRISA